MGCFILAVSKTGDYCLKMLQVRTREFRFVECCDATTVFKKSHAWDHSLPPTRSVADLSDVASDDEETRSICSIYLEKGGDGMESRGVRRNCSL